MLKSKEIGWLSSLTKEPLRQISRNRNLSKKAEHINKHQKPNHRLLENKSTENRANSQNRKILWTWTTLPTLEGKLGSFRRKLPQTRDEIL